VHTNAAAYFAPLVVLPIIIDAPGRYVTRAGDIVTIEHIAAGFRFVCSGRYDRCGTHERWHRSGRVLATSETPNDIVGIVRRVVVMNGSRLIERHNGRAG
jgi:hypothetical protein